MINYFIAISHVASPNLRVRLNMNMGVKLPLSNNGFLDKSH